MQLDRVMPVMESFKDDASYAQQQYPAYMLVCPYNGNIDRDRLERSTDLSGTDLPHIDMSYTFIL